jgi:peptide/nickel transport system permease protein
MTSALPRRRRRLPGLGGNIVRRLGEDRLTAVGAGLIVLLMVSAVFAPVVAPYDPREVDIVNRWQPPSASHPFGTDFFGRDVFSRVIHGARLSLLIGILTLAINSAIGLPVGLLAGYVGGAFDNFIMRIGDVLLAFPTLLFAMALMAVRGVGLTEIIIALTFKGWVEIARLVRSEVLSLKEREFSLAANAIGAPSWRIITRHMLPNSLSAFTAYAPLGITIPILAEASLSFLGLGIQPPVISWGQMIGSEWTYVRSAWWPVAFPGMAIGVAVFGFSLLGDGLRDALDIKLEQ